MNGKKHKTYRNETQFIEILQWDSNFFNRRVAKVKNSLVINKNMLEPFIQEINNEKINFFYYFQDTAITENLALLFQNRIILIDIEIILVANTMPYKIKNNIPFFDLLQSNFNNINLEPLYSMATDLAEKSRFYLDGNIEKSLVYKLYKKWIDNSLFGGMADYFFILGTPSDPFSFVVYKKNGDDVATLTLICSKKEMRGKGYGKEIIRKSFSFLSKDKIKHCYVKTQLSNLRAIKFYESLGFKINKSRFIFHWHKITG